MEFTHRHQTAPRADPPAEAAPHYVDILVAVRVVVDGMAVGADPDQPRLGGVVVVERGVVDIETV